MPRIPKQQDVAISLARYETDKITNASDAVTNAFLAIGDELYRRDWDSKYDTLPHEVRNFFDIWVADGQIENGGLAQFFYNGCGKRAESTVRAFYEIGAPKKAAILASAMASFPDGKYPRSIDEYSIILEHHEDELEFLNNKILNKKYFQSGEDISKLLVEYVKNNFDKFAP
jgi:hypothetical protein